MSQGYAVYRYPSVGDHSTPPLSAAHWLDDNYPKSATSCAIIAFYPPPFDETNLFTAWTVSPSELPESPASTYSDATKVNRAAPAAAIVAAGIDPRRRWKVSEHWWTSFYDWHFPAGFPDDGAHMPAGSILLYESRNNLDNLFRWTRANVDVERPGIENENSTAYLLLPRSPHRWVEFPPQACDNMSIRQSLISQLWREYFSDVGEAQMGLNPMDASLYPYVELMGKVCHCFMSGANEIVPSPSSKIAASDPNR